MTLEELEQIKDVPVIIADHDGFVTFINKPFQDAFGWRPQDIIGFPLLLIIPEKLRDAHVLGFSRFLMTRKSKILNRPIDLKIVTKDGNELDSKHFITAEEKDGHWRFGAVIEQPSRSQV